MTTCDHCWHDMTETGADSTERQACCGCGEWQEWTETGWIGYTPSSHEAADFRSSLRDLGVAEDDLPCLA